MIDAGHLKPGLFKSNIGDDTLVGNGESAMDQGNYYFSSPGDTIYALVRALPHVSATLQGPLRAYIRAEMDAYPIDTYAYVGHRDGSPRQAAAVPPDYEPRFRTGPQANVVNDYPWRFPMMAYYAAWKYAQVWPAEAPRLYSTMRPKLTVPCLLPDTELLSSVQALNAYIAGYIGFLELEKLAGRPESVNVRQEYTRLLNLRVATFSIDLPFTASWKHRNFIMARHFLYMVPELADALRETRMVEVERALDRINQVTPYWFVAGVDTTNREGTHQQLYDVATFNAYAMILQAPYRELVRYLDAPAFQTGDLLYLHNLVSALDAATRRAQPTGLRLEVVP
jgi:hypothetical protein